MTYTRTRLLPARSSGFTLVELLVVIGIIAILVGLLLPVVNKIHKIAYDADTKNEIGQIAAACDRYYLDFRAYPGPLSNTDIESLSNGSGQTTGAGFNDTYYGLSMFGAALNPVNHNKMFISGSQNLTLGLLGGLRRDTVNGLTIQFVNGSQSVTTPPTPSTLIGIGPVGLLNPFTNPGSAKQYTAYLSINYPGSNMMENGDGSFQAPPTVQPTLPLPPTNTGGYHDAQGNMFADSIIPVFTDKYPDPMPILYLRARVGAKGILSGPGTSSSPTLIVDPSSNATAYYNYDLRQIVPYTYISPNNPPVAGQIAPGLGKTSGFLYSQTYPSASGPTPTGQHGIQGVGTLDVNVFSTDTSAVPPALTVAAAALQSEMWDAPVPNITTNNTKFDNAGQYFMNPAVQPSNVTANPGGSISSNINATGTPRNKDSYILISAGPDRTYGTKDDITNFGNVEP